MTEIHRLLATVKRQLKLRGLTYRQVGEALDLSEPSVKRLFSTGSLTLERLAQLTKLLDMSLAELVQEVASEQAPLSHLSVQQEQELVSDTALLLVAVCVLNHWPLEKILQNYQLSEAECVQKLLRLDKISLIDVLPGNRVRLNVTRNFDWLPDGPIRLFFRELALGDFVNSPFSGQFETLDFAHGMLTRTATLQLQTKLRRLRQEFAELHKESLEVPFEQRHGTGLLLALREWEPQGFESLRKPA
ncbi:helix-turn-helix domain-containing protein [Herbaspirillum autotrophicum]|uniref:helix-turn-helix domain-containing protein n=1 Tax=Herbaspirillum autotrophicum TaxID=180195 RepID=UPI00067A94B5|nr:helix-turn-helix domain-containing protein [Herbaspirillum autotrophicum]